MDSVYFKIEDREKRIKERQEFFKTFHPSLQEIQDLNYRFLTGSSKSLQQQHLNQSHAPALAILLAVFDSDMHSIYALGSFIYRNRTVVVWGSSFKWFAYARSLLVDDMPMYWALRQAFGEKYGFRDYESGEFDFLKQWIFEEGQPWKFQDDFVLPSLFWMIPEKKASFLGEITLNDGKLFFFKQPLMDCIPKAISTAIEADEQMQMIPVLEKFFTNSNVLFVLYNRDTIESIAEAGNLTKLLDLLKQLAKTTNDFKKVIGKIASTGAQYNYPLVIKELIEYCKVNEIDFNWSETGLLKEVLEDRKIEMLNCIKEMDLTEQEQTVVVNSMIRGRNCYGRGLEFVKAIVEFVKEDWNDVYSCLAKAISSYCESGYESQIEYLVNQEKFLISNITLEQWIEASKTLAYMSSIIRFIGIVEKALGLIDPKPLYDCYIKLMTVGNVIDRARMLDFNKVLRSDSSLLLYTGLSIAICYYENMEIIIFPRDPNWTVDLTVIAEHFGIESYSNFLDVYTQIYEMAGKDDSLISIKAMDTILSHFDHSDKSVDMHRRKNQISCQKLLMQKTPCRDLSSSNLVNDHADTRKRHCKICLARDNDLKIRLSCNRNHLVHLDCLFDWSRHHSDCPACQKDVPEVHEMYDKHRELRC